MFFDTISPETCRDIHRNTDVISASQFNAGVWLSTDGGASWLLNPIGTTYDAQCISSETVLAATGIEGNPISISQDHGLDFSHFTGGLTPHATPEQFTSTDAYLFAGMDYGGVWRRLRPDATGVPAQIVDLGGPQLRNYPNPFAATTRIRFALPAAGPARLTVYDVSGRRVATLLDGEGSAGSHEVEFDGKGLPPGVYLYRLETGGRSEMGRMVRIEKGR
jgi:hypothetical protein